MRRRRSAELAEEESATESPLVQLNNELSALDAQVRPLAPPFNHHHLDANPLPPPSTPNPRPLTPLPHPPTFPRRAAGEKLTNPNPNPNQLSEKRAQIHFFKAAILRNDAKVSQ